MGIFNTLPKSPKKGHFHTSSTTHTTLQLIIKSSKLSSNSHTPKTRQNRPKTAKNSVFRPQNRQNDGSPSGAKFSGPDPQKSSFFDFFNTSATLQRYHQQFIHIIHTHNTLNQRHKKSEKIGPGTQIRASHSSPDTQHTASERPHGSQQQHLTTTSHHDIYALH